MAGTVDNEEYVSLMLALKLCIKESVPGLVRVTHFEASSPHIN